MLPLADYITLSSQISQAWLTSCVWEDNVVSGQWTVVDKEAIGILALISVHLAPINTSIPGLRTLDPLLGPPQNERAK